MIKENNDISVGLVRWIKRCNNHDLNKYYRFYVGDTALGWVARKHLERYLAEPELFFFSDNKLTFHPKHSTPEARSRVIAPLLQSWKNKGWVYGWRNEYYRASVDFHQEPEFVLERSAAQLFGLQHYGVHLNGYVQKADGLYMWIAKRNPNRPRYPGLLDQMVAGGLTAGETASETLIRECAEEASVPSALAQQASSTGLITLFMEEDDCIKRDVIFTYDLELPETFVPESADGEVEYFCLIPVEEVMNKIAHTEEIKLNCNLVMIDFMVRHGYLTPENTHYSEIVSGLHSGSLN